MKMETIRHHLGEGVLAAYAVGELPEAFALVVATHASVCDECRARLASLEAVGGAVLDRTEMVAVASGSLAATMSRIRAGAPAEAPLREASDLPAPLAEYVGGGLDAVRWRPVGGGVKQAVLETAGSSSVRLIQIPGGAAVPEHGHGGMELTLVLRGAFRDERDRFGPGDVETADAALEHMPVAEAGAACICLAASDARLRFRGLLPRLAQPFIGI
jgi:putative transcriptional regulator